MKNFFRPATRKKVYQDVVEQVQNAIVKGELKEGERLPAEHALRRMFDVSRMTLREALRVLEEKRLIEIRPGKSGGVFVRSVFSKESSGKKLDLLIRFNKVTLDDLAEFRESVEGNIAAVAAQKADQADMRRLSHYVDKAGNCIDRGSSYVGTHIAYDQKVHLVLAQITRNPLFTHIIQTTHNVDSYFDRFMQMEKKSLKNNFSDLMQIAGAVSLRQPGRASDLSRNHVRRFNQL